MEFNSAHSAKYFHCSCTPIEHNAACAREQLRIVGSGKRTACKSYISIQKKRALARRATQKAYGVLVFERCACA